MLKLFVLARRAEIEESFLSFTVKLVLLNITPRLCECCDVKCLKRGKYTAYKMKVVLNVTIAGVENPKPCL